MISKELLNYFLTVSVFFLIIAIFLNVIFLVFTRNYTSQDFFKNDLTVILCKIFSNLSLLLVCIFQIFVFYFFFDFTIRTQNLALFYDLLSHNSQAYFYGKLYDMHFSKGLLYYTYSLDSFGIVVQFVGIIVGYISYLVLDTRFFYKNVKYLSVFCIFSVVVILFTTTNNIIFFFLFYELLLLPAFLLVYFLSQARRATQASLYFIIWTQFGSFLVLCATAYIIVLTGKFSFTEVRLFKFTQNEIYLIYFLYFFGFGFKIPIWPLHYWLTKTHVEASAGFSMYLSGFLVKTALYGFYKYTAVLGTGLNTTLFVTIAAVGIVDASIKMFSQVDLKKLVAFCTIQEMNMIYMMLAWGDSIGCISAILFIITHAFLSSLMFFLVDCMQRRYNSRSTLEVSGLIHITPNLGIAIFVMCILYCGMPGTMKFTCEFFIFSQIIGVSFLFTLILLIFANLIGVVGFCRCWFNVLFGMSEKYSRMGIIDLNFKEVYIILFCVIFLIGFSYTPSLFF